MTMEEEFKALLLEKQVEIDKLKSQMTGTQLFEYLDFLGVIPKESGYEPRT